MNNNNNRHWMPIDDESHLNGNGIRFSSWRNVNLKFKMKLKNSLVFSPNEQKMCF